MPNETNNQKASEKIKKILQKESVDSQYEILQQIKGFVSQNIDAEQKILQDKASELQSKSERINGV